MGSLLGLFVMLLGGGVGFPIPEDLTLLGAGVLAHQRVLRLPEVIAVGIVAVSTADWIIYLTGRRYGRGIVRLPVLARLFGAGRLDTVRSAVERHGMRAVFAARFVLGFRMVTFLGAGIFGMPARRFAFAEAAGTILFVPAMVAVGFVFTDQAMHVAGDVGRAQRWIVLVGLAVLAGWLALRAWNGRAGLGGGSEVDP